MTVRCVNCQTDVLSVDEVRGCQRCHVAGTAGKIHCKYKGSDPIEGPVADAGGSAKFFTPDGKGSIGRNPH